MQRQQEPNADRLQNRRGRSSVLPRAAVQRAPLAGTPMTPGQARALQGTAGNAAVVQRLARDREDQAPHQHSEGCGHLPAVQRSKVPEVLKTPGEQFDGPLRTEMEGRFNRSLSHLRLHTDALAQESAAQIGAEAYTSRNHMVFTPAALRNKRTVAHEIAHTIDQENGTVPGTDQGDGTRMSSPGDAGERSADAKANEVMSKPMPPSEAAQASDTGRAPVQRAAAQSHGPAAVQRSSYDEEMDYGYESAIPGVEYSRGRSTAPRMSAWAAPSMASRPPSYYDDGQMDVDDQGPIIVDAHPPGSSSRRPSTSRRSSSHARSSLHDTAQEDTRGRRPRAGSRPPLASAGRPAMRRSSSYAPPGRDAERMDVDGQGPIIIDARPGRSSSRRPEEPRIGVGPRGPRQVRDASREGRSADPRARQSTSAQLLAIGNQVLAEVKQRIGRGAANQLAAAAAAGDGLHHMLGASRGAVARQPVGDRRARLGQDAAIAAANGVGNCGEHAAMVFCLLNRKNLPSGVSIWLVELSIDHAFVAVGRRNRPGDIVVLDAWQNGTRAVLARNFTSFPFLDRNGKITREATEYAPDGKDYLKIGRSTVDLEAATETMDTTGPAVSEQELLDNRANMVMAQNGWNHQQLRQAVAQYIQEKYGRPVRPEQVGYSELAMFFGMWNQSMPGPSRQEESQRRHHRHRRREPSRSAQVGLMGWLTGRR
ncbi:eCIS core domain-containing protein [Spirillospora sp. CA-294931]|uniref:eCIS core domain-containing protein n=1 Tax=Spirillospora sp. CA-294931 TaxID=3240042 RepID=UPI003D8D8C1D